MTLFTGIVSWKTLGADALRLVLCAILFTHGAYRFYEGSSPELGAILAKKGFPFGVVLAYSVNVMETAGSLLVALRRFVLPLCFALASIYVTGILLFHRHAGFFVVGPGEGGWEYSALLITCLLVTAWENRARRFS